MEKKAEMNLRLMHRIYILKAFSFSAVSFIVASGHPFSYFFCVI